MASLIHMCDGWNCTNHAVDSLTVANIRPSGDGKKVEWMHDDWRTQWLCAECYQEERVKRYWGDDG